jgi:hypothetical protein
MVRDGLGGSCSRWEGETCKMQGDCRLRRKALETDAERDIHIEERETESCDV